MYIQRIQRKQNNKTYTSTILAHSYRENGKQKRETIAVLTKWPKHLVSAIECALKGEASTHLQEFTFTQGKSFGALFVVNEVAKRLGLHEAFKRTDYAQVSLLQIFARALNQGSQKSIVPWTDTQAIQEVLGIECPSLKRLYENLSILSERQKHIENKLYRQNTPPQESVNIYLYDVTSSYLEGQYNELATYGYNRDKKRGKKQIVIGLLCDGLGCPISIEVFEGNTNDTQTFLPQVQKIKERFNVNKVIMVGDKGMIKSTQIEQLKVNEFCYITSISKPQINSLLKSGVLQLDLFDEKLLEITHQRERYLLRRNPVRQNEIRANRTARLAKIETMVKQSNAYLNEHPRAKVETQHKKIAARIATLKLERLLSVIENEDSVSLVIDEEGLEKEQQLDGCYVIKTNVGANEADAKTIHERYKDLAKLESTFRTIKTEHLEVRPLFLRKANRTKGHVLICMLAYKIIRYIREATKELGFTLDDVMNNLKAIQYIVYDVQGVKVKQLPSKLSETQQTILNVLDIKLPKTL